MKFHISFVLIAMFSAYNSTAQTNDPLEHKADTLYKIFKYDSAAFYFKRAAVKYEQEKDWMPCVKNYRLTSNAFLKAAKYDTAWFYSNKALCLTEQYFHENNKEEMFEKSDVYLNMANVLEKEGNYEDELLKCKDALTLMSKAGSSDVLRIASIWNKTGVAYANLGESDSALWFCTKALNTRVKMLGEEDIDIADSYNNIGRIYFYNGDYDNGMEYFKKSLEIRIRTLGEKHPDVAIGYINLGILYDEKGEYDKALKYYQKALKVRITTLGKQHPDVANCYNTIGIAYYNKDDYEKALEYSQKALKIYIETLGEQHPKIADSYNIIGLAYEGLGDYDKALKYCQKDLEIIRALFDNQHQGIAYSCNDIGGIYKRKGDPVNALRYYQKSLTTNNAGFTDTCIYSNPELDNVLSKPILLVSLLEKAHAFYQLYKSTNSVQDIEASVSVYELAFQLTNKMRNSYNIEDTKLLLSEKTKVYYTQAAHVALEYATMNPLIENNERAFEFIELGKSATLAAQFNEYQAKHFAGIPNSLLEAEKELKRKISYCKPKLLIIKATKMVTICKWSIH